MNTKLRCLLLDDELPDLAYLKLLCEQMPELEVVRAFNDPLIFMKESEDLEFDLCILDIEMPGINGIQLAGMLNDKAVIFTTADPIGVIKNNAEIKEAIRAIEQEAPNHITLSNGKIIDEQFVRQFQLMVISTEGWNKLIDSRTHWLDKTPSILILQE